MSNGGGAAHAVWEWGVPWSSVKASAAGRVLSPVLGLRGAVPSLYNSALAIFHLNKDLSGSKRSAPGRARAKVAELVDALALGASGATRESSSLSFRTRQSELLGRYPAAQ